MLSRKVKILIPPLLIAISLAIASAMIATRPKQELAPAQVRSVLVDVA